MNNEPPTCMDFCGQWIEIQWSLIIEWPLGCTARLDPDCTGKAQFGLTV